MFQVRCIISDHVVQIVMYGFVRARKRLLQAASLKHVEPQVTEQQDTHAQNKIFVKHVGSVPSMYKLQVSNLCHVSSALAMLWPLCTACIATSSLQDLTGFTVTLARP